MFLSKKRISSLLAATLLVVSAASLRAQLVAEPASLDLGRHLQQQAVEAEVKLINKGSRPVQILHVGADCSCTAADPKKKDLAPGEETTLSIIVETRAYNGELHRRVSVRTSEGDVQIPIKLRVAVYQNWEVNPSPAVLPPSMQGEEAVAKVKLTYSGSAGAEITRAVAQPDWLKPSIVREDSGKDFLLTLTKPARTPAGNHTVRVEITTTDPVTPQIMLTAFVPVASSLRVSPSPIALPVVKVGQKTSMTLRIDGWHAQADPRFNIEQGEVRVTRRDGDAVEAQLMMQLAQPGVSTRLLGIFVGDQMELEVPVIVRVEP